MKTNRPVNRMMVVAAVLLMSIASMPQASAFMLDPVEIKLEVDLPPIGMLRHPCLKELEFECVPLEPNVLDEMLQHPCLRELMEFECVPTPVLCDYPEVGLDPQCHDPNDLFCPLPTVGVPPNCFGGVPLPTVPDVPLRTVRLIT